VNVLTVVTTIADIVGVTDVNASDNEDGLHCIFVLVVSKVKASCTGDVAIATIFTVAIVGDTALEVNANFEVAIPTLAFGVTNDSAKAILLVVMLLVVFSPGDTLVMVRDIGVVAILALTPVVPVISVIVQ
jgi:hypothetical protein